jgi:hypothetical protein
MKPINAVATDETPGNDHWFAVERAVAATRAGIGL